MATIYKRRRRKPIPEGAETISRSGKQFAVWTSRGRRQRAPLSDDGGAIIVEPDTYTVEWFDHEGKRRRKGTRIGDKDAAQRLANHLETQAAKRREGLIDASQERFAQEGRRTIGQHLTDYEAKMKAANREPKYVATTISYIRTIAEAAGFAAIGHITADGVNAYASHLQERRSARTVQAHLTAIKGFTRWLAREGKLPADPVASVSKPNPKTDRRRERRMLLPEEWDWLRSITADGGERYGMAPRERVLFYAVAIQTGLRSSELRSLTRGRLFLDADDPFITCKAGSTKNRKDARQYIQHDLADELRALIATKAPQALVFNMPHRFDVAAMLRADLADARRAWLKTARHDPEEYPRREQSDFLADVNHEGEHLDFHSLRHTCGAWLAMAGAHPKAVQAVMRHSTITLTMDTYGHLFPGQEAATVARFPELLSDGPETMRATGTDDEGARKWAHQGQQLNGKRRQALAAGGEKSSKPTREADEAQVVTLPRNEKSRRVVATAGEQRRARDSNLQPASRRLISSLRIAGRLYSDDGLTLENKGVAKNDSAYRRRRIRGFGNTFGNTWSVSRAQRRVRISPASHQFPRWSVWRPV